ncbi:MAG: carotenoid 1,2-hydratase [Deltaproteobacteria bacterium]|nr:carotenoid 1,2-hydratase [Deltaproteobacteria bacterium]
MNLCLYGPYRHRWAYTEVGARHLEQSPEHLRIHQSQLYWEEGRLVLEVDETQAPLGGRLKGRIVLDPGARFSEPEDLAGTGRHLWWPLAPFSRAEVALESPGLSFSGAAYHDANMGSEPIEDGLRRWWWMRAPLSEGAAVLYDAIDPAGEERPLGLFLGRDGSREPISAAVPGRLRPTRWLMPRPLRSGHGRPPRLLKAYEDTPFYARSLVELELRGERTRGVYEVVDLDRFASRWVQALLPYRMKRIP